MSDNAFHVPSYDPDRAVKTIRHDAFIGVSDLNPKSLAQLQYEFEIKHGIGRGSEAHAAIMATKKEREAEKAGRQEELKRKRERCKVEVNFFDLWFEFELKKKREAEFEYTHQLQLYWKRRDEAMREIDDEPYPERMKEKMRAYWDRNNPHPGDKE